jgi:8-oxo-dGTP pyrophosphatase MutT (NUDIX family)
MVKLIEQIEKHIPFDELEAEEKENFLQFVKAFGNNIYTRENRVGHLTPSCWIVNKDRTKVLMIHHSARDIWSWLGGHADGDTNLLNVALKEAEEESGLKNIKVLSKDIFDLSTLLSSTQIKNGKPLSAHLHYTPTFLFEADEAEELKMSENEAKDIRWLSVDEVIDKVPLKSDKILYSRLIAKIKALK